MTKIPLYISLSHFRHLLQKLNLFFSYEFQPSTSINYFFLPSNVPSILVIFLSFVVVGLEIFKNLQIWVWDTKLNEHHYQEQGWDNINQKIFFFPLVNLLAMLDILIHFMKGPLTMYSFFKLWHGSSPPEIGRKLLLLCERVVLHVLISWLDRIG